MTLTTKEPGTPDVVDAGTPRTPPPAGGGGETPSNSGQILRLLAALALITVVFVVAGLGDLLLFILIIVLIVMLHELAHFATAKWCGMKVTEYFVGFGPRLWSFRRGETEYGVKAIPAGGYVKITGFTSLEDVDPEDEPRTYRQQAFWKRIVVASAGSVMHFIIAFVLALIVAFSWGVPTNNQTVGIDHWIGVAHTPAQLAGLRTGDVIVSYNGHSLTGPNTLQNDLKGTKAGQPVTLGVDRDGRLLHVSVTPRNGKGLKDSLGPLKNRPYIGVNLSPANASENPLQAIKTATFNIGSYTKQEVLGTGRLFSASGLSSFYNQVTNSKAAAKASANPTTDNRPLSLVGIASLGVHDQQHGGLQQLFVLLILVNIIFGLLNMLPMIPLDGGHVAVAAYEWIRTKKGQAFYRADITKMFPVVAVFLAFLMVITISAVYLDITHPLQIH